MFWKIPHRQYLIKVSLLTGAISISSWLILSQMEIGPQPSPVWPSAGIALGVLLLWGEKMWPGIFLGDLLVMQILGASWLDTGISALASTLSAIIGIKLLKHYHFSPRLERIQDIVILGVGAAIVCPAINASLDIMPNWFRGEAVLHDWGIIWLGDSTGILVFTPPILRWRLATDKLFTKHSQERLIEASICFGLLLAVSWLVFAGDNLARVAEYSLEYLPFPVVVWAALRFRTWGAVSANLLISILALWGTIEGFGPFVMNINATYQAILLLQIFITVVCLTSLILSAAMSERQDAFDKLTASLERDRLLAEVALRIHESLDLDHILATTVTEIEKLLPADRVFYLDKNRSYQNIAYDYFISEISHQDLLNKRSLVINDTANCKFKKQSKFWRQYYRSYNIRATLIVPILSDNEIKGLLVAEHFFTPRNWTKSEIDLLVRLGTQVAIALQQAQLYQQVQTLNSNLEQQVQERTLQLQEKMEELQDLYEMKSVFLQAVAHDMRTAIMGLVMIFRNWQNKAADNISVSCSMLGKITISSDRLLTLINALSEDHFSLGRKLDINCQQISLQELLENLLQENQCLLQRNQAKLKIIMSDNLPNIWADTNQLSWVFVELLNNAVKHNSPGLNITIEGEIKNGWICCNISDDGVGMSQEQCQHLFKVYVRSFYNHRLTGVGLGSYQCRQIIEAHGGRIGVNSSPGEGSQFWFTLPIAE